MQPPSKSTCAGFPRAFGSKYVLLKQIGAGGMGKVFLAASGAAGMRRVCAIKTLVADHLPEPAKLTQRFIDEARLVTRLEHDNLVYVFDAGVEAGTRYFAMEYVRGKSLTEVVARCAELGVPFPLFLSLHVVLELASALEYVHDFDGLGLVHRDLSPGNVMLGYSGAVKLIDFGVAKWRDRTTRTRAGIQWGKQGYKAPEQLVGHPADRRTDLYALGVVLWELLAGQRLFSERDMAMLRPEIPAPSSINRIVSPELDAVVAKATAADPTARFQTAAELRSALLENLAPGDYKPMLASFLTQLFEKEAAVERSEEDSLVGDAGGLDSSVDASAPVSSTSGTAEGDSLLGTVLADRYEVLRVIGRGAMGIVYEGYHRGVRRRVAIKVPNPDERDPELVRRLTIEAAAAGRLLHPNIAQVTDCGETPFGTFFFVMEYLDGVGLHEVTYNEAPLPVDRALRIAIQICRAIGAAHSEGVVHRDLKPSNVMLIGGPDGSEQVKVLDFGLAKLTHPTALDLAEDGVTMPGAVIGSPAYAAPEQIDGAAEVNHASDIYAVAAILFEMLTGQAPHEGDDVEDVCRRKLREDAPHVRGLRGDASPALDSLLMSALSRDPGERPTNAAAFEKALAAELERVSVNSSFGGVSEDGPVRRRWPAVVGAAALLLVGALTGWRLLRADGHRAGSKSASHAVLDDPAPLAVTTPDRKPPSQPPLPGMPIAAPKPPSTLGAFSKAEAPSPTHEAVVQAQGRPAGARKARNPASVQDGQPEEEFSKGQAAFNDGEFESARAHAVAAVAAGGGMRARILLASALFKLGRYAEAEKEYAAVLRLDPGNATAADGRERAHKLAHRGPAEP